MKFATRFFATSFLLIAFSSLSFAKETDYDQRVTQATAHLSAAIRPGVWRIADRMEIRAAFYEVIGLFDQIANNSNLSSAEQEKLFEKLEEGMAPAVVKLNEDFLGVDDDPNQEAADQASAGLAAQIGAWLAGAGKDVAVGMGRMVVSFFNPKNDNGEWQIPPGWPVVGEYARLDRVMRPILNEARAELRHHKWAAGQDGEARKLALDSLKDFADAFTKCNPMKYGAIHSLVRSLMLTGGFILAANPMELWPERTAWGPRVFGTLYALITLAIARTYSNETGLRDYAIIQDLRRIAEVEYHRVGFGIGSIFRRTRDFALDPIFRATRIRPRLNAACGRALGLIGLRPRSQRASEE